MRSPIFFLVFLSLIVFNSISFSQTGVIRGTVLTIDSNAAERVNITLREINARTVSSVSGNYQFDHVRPGIYTLIASHTGLQTQRKPVIVSNSDTTILDITLVENRSELEEVIIVGTK